MKTFLILSTSALLLTACGGEEVVRPAVNVSVGQQLIDLKQARANGAITQSEYEKQRKMLIDSVQ